MADKMFCYQCEETAGNKGCTSVGVCGKTDSVAALQDLLVYVLKGVSFYAVKARELGATSEDTDLFVAEGLFTTVTNVNFDEERMIQAIRQALAVRGKTAEAFAAAHQKKYGKAYEGQIPEQASWSSEYAGDFVEKGRQVGVLTEANEDVRSLKELLIYGIKGVAAYADHAYVLKRKDPEILAFLQEALVATIDPALGADDLLGLVVKAGDFSVRVMALLDVANTETFGDPEVTQVNTGTEEGPAILVSGHDLLDVKELLEQTEGTGVRVYTHGELLPANAYPALKKFKHLSGNYGTSWYNQQEEFDAFNGAILMTTNCIQKPLDTYKDRIFTTGLVAWPGLAHISDRAGDKPKDYSEVIKKAKSLGGLKKTEGKSLTIGFAHAATLQNAGAIVEAVKSGAIKRFVVMAGCDGRHKGREYFTEVASKLPKEAVILTAGCAKFRYNSLDLGDIGGIPRVIDAGQCNDSYSLVVTALKLVEAFGVKSVNDLPLSFDIAWYEQKAVCVLLALLFLGVKGIRLGPTLPAFVSAGVLKVLVEKFEIKPTTTADKDVADMMGAAVTA